MNYSSSSPSFSGLFPFLRFGGEILPQLNAVPLGVLTSTQVSVTVFPPLVLNEQLSPACLFSHALIGGGGPSGLLGFASMLSKNAPVIKSDNATANADFFKLNLLVYYLFINMSPVDGKIIFYNQ